MNTLSYKTRSQRKEDVQPRWWVVDAEGQHVGRMSSRIAHILRGKHKPEFTPHVDCGDYVVVLNAEKVAFSGQKWDQKRYITFSGYPGGQKIALAKELWAKQPEAIVERAVKGMLPKNKLGRAMFKKLFVYTGSEHPHAAQKPENMTF
jgi:large subunit ribosomal protein L13